MKNAVKYGELWLMSGSVAHQLHKDGKMKELAEHMREVEQRHKNLIDKATKEENATQS